jgi:PKD repeat protein
VEGALANYRWDFGDGSAVQEGATLLNPTHTFATVGNYTVSLTVTDALGASNTAQSSISIAPICTAPQFLRRGECVSPALTNTGITASQCYAAGSDVLFSCSSAPAIALNASQDGMLGTDVTMPDAADGKLGFSYRTVPNPAGGSFAVTECVKDMLTGLTWEGKTATGLRAGSASYTNYDNTAQAQFWNGTTYVNPTQAQIDAASNAVGYKNAVNASALCGYTDWRLPTADELQSLVDYSVATPDEPTIDSTWFPNTPGSGSTFPPYTPGGTYWSATPTFGRASGAWTVDFNNGSVGFSDRIGRYNTNHVRLVR